jgi:hypoxia up-regulated 1
MFAARSFLVEATQNNTLAKEAQANATPEKPVAPPKYTDAELEDVKTRMKELEVWMDGLMTEQVKLDGDNTKDPVIFTKDLDEKGKALQMMVSWTRQHTTACRGAYGLR